MIFKEFFTTGIWVLIAFIAFFSFFGKRIFTTFLNTVDNKAKKIKNLIVSIQKEKEEMQNRFDKRELELRCIMEQCQKIQDKADMRIKKLSIENKEKIKILGKNMSEALDKRMKQLEAHFEQISKKKAIDLCGIVVAKGLIEEQEKNIVQESIEMAKYVQQSKEKRVG